MGSTDRGRLRLDRRNALKAVTLSAAALAAGAGMTDVLAAAPPTPPPDPNAGLSPHQAHPASVTPPVFGITYQMFAGSDFHARAGTAYTFPTPGTAVRFSPGAGDYFVMPVSVPKGSVLTECECYFVNNDTGTFFLEVQITDPSNNSRDVSNSTSSSTVGASPQLLRVAPLNSLGMTPTDPSRYGIELLAGNGGAAYLYGARIGYVAATQVNMLASPIRLLETRPPFEDPSPGQTKPHRPLNTGETFDLPIAGQVIGGQSVPIGAHAVIGNVTVTNPVGGGFLKLFPQGATLPPTSSINYGPGQTVANGVIVGLSMGGALSIYVSAQTDVIFDASGYVA